MVCRLALEHPELVKSLIIVNSGSLMVSRNHWLDLCDRQAESIKDLREKIRYFILVNSFTGEHITDKYLDALVEGASLPKSEEAVAKMKAGLFSRFKGELADRLKETHEWIGAGGIKVPTLIVWGYNDPCAKFDPMGLFVLQMILPHAPRSEMHIINQAGHWCFREQPKAFISAVTSFTKSDTH